MILRGGHCPRGRLGGVIAGGVGELSSAGSGIRTGGIRAALAAIEGLGGAGLAVQSHGGGRSGGGEDDGGGGGEEEQRATKVARLEGEIERLRSENLRWQQVCVLCFVFCVC